MSDSRIPFLLARVGDTTCAFPIEAVIETMRPGPVTDGMVMHRGERVPVITLASGPGERSVVVRLGVGRAAIVVDAVLRVDRLELRRLGRLRHTLTEVSDEARLLLDRVRTVDEA